MCLFYGKFQQNDWNAQIRLPDTNNGHLYCAGIRQVWCSWRMNIIPSVSGPVISYPEPSQLPGEYAAHAAKCVAQRA